MSFIEEIKTFDGPVYYCFLCGEHVDVSEKLTHDKEEGHMVLCNYETSEAHSIDDKLLRVKSESLASSEAEFLAVKNIVLTCERTLKLVSDLFVKDLILETKRRENVGKSSNDDDVEMLTSKKNDNKYKNIECLKTIKEYSENDDADEMMVVDSIEGDGDKENESSSAWNNPNENDVGLIIGERKLRGSMRVGLLGNGLLMSGDVKVWLVVASVDKPTFTMLRTIYQYFVEQIPKVTTDIYEMTLNESEGCIVVVPTVCDVPDVSCTISITSPLIRRHPFHLFNDNLPPDPEDMLPRKPCEDALQAIRRTRWFETKMYLLNHCEPVFRIVRDLARNDPALKIMDEWILQQLLFKVLSSSSGVQMSLSEAIYRFFECLSSGALLPDGPGLYDPCERAPTNLCYCMSLQEREDITYRSQELLRQISQKRMFEILNIPEHCIDDRVKRIIEVLKQKKKNRMVY